MNRQSIIVPLLATLLSACVTSPLTSPPALPGLTFAYDVLAPDPLHLVQAFDDGTNTYIQLSDIVPPAIEVLTDSGGRPLEYRLTDHFVVVTGVHSNIRLSAGELQTTISNQAGAGLGGLSGEQTATVLPAPPEAVITERPGDVVSGASPPLTHSETMRIAELLRLKSTTGPATAPTKGLLDEKLLQLSLEVEDAKRAGGGLAITFRESSGAPRVTLTFEEGSAQPQVDPALLTALGEASRAANRIFLHAHTDEFIVSAAGRTLAIARAVAVRTLLVSLSVEPQHIRLFYRGAGDFAANNSTPEGKALNRRVEIELRR